MHIAMSLKVVSTEAYLSPDHEFYLHGDLVWEKLGMDLAHHFARMLHPTLARPRCHQHRCLAELDDEHEAMDGDLDGKNKGERQQRTGRIIKGVGDRHAASDGRRPTSLGVPRSSGVHRPPGSGSAIWGLA